MNSSTLRCTLLVLRCEALEETRGFYETLGASFDEEAHAEGPRHYAADVAGMILELYPGDPDSGTRIGFTVSDVDAIVEELEARGAPVRVAPSESARGRRAVVVDPDGRRVELVQPRLDH